MSSRNRSREQKKGSRRSRRPRSVPRRDAGVARSIRDGSKKVKRKPRNQTAEVYEYGRRQNNRESIYSTQYGSVHRSGQKGKPVKLIAFVIVLLVIVGGLGVGVYFGVVPTDALTGTSTPAILITTTLPPGGISTTAPGVMISPISDEEWVRLRGDCGRPLNRPDLSRIVGGTEAVKHSWPWQIGLLKYKEYDATTATVKAICGGSLVGPTFVITATHCFLDSTRTSLSTTSSDFRVLIGGHAKGKESDGAKMLEIESIHHHPDNNLATFSKMRQLPIHDITVLVVRTAVDPSIVSPMAAFVCLPKPYAIPASKKKCWATGWGKTHGTGYDSELKQVAQPIASEYECKRKYGSNGIFKEKHLCAGPYRGSEGTCQGDSGGPLVCQYDDGVWVLHGATSFGPRPCGISPGVWTQVSYHLDWVCCILRNYAACKEIKCLW